MQSPVSDHPVINSETLPAITQPAESLPGAFFICHADGKQELIDFSSRPVSPFGCESDEEIRALTGNSFRGTVRPDDCAAVESDIGKRINTDDNSLDRLKYRFLRGDGSVGMPDDYGRFSHSEHSYGPAAAGRRMGIIPEKSMRVWVK